MLEKTAIILGEDHVNTLGLARSLGEKNYAVYTAIRSLGIQTFTDKSKYIVKSFHKETYLELIDEILICFKDTANKLPLIPSSDGAAMAIYQYRDDLKQTFIFPQSVGEYEFSFLTDKHNVLSLATAVGLQIPKSVATIISRDNPDCWLEMFSGLSNSYPLIIKPQSAENRSSPICIVVNEKELMKVLAQYKDIPILVQEYIYKDEEIGVQGVGFGRDRMPIVPGIIHKLRTSDISMGSTSYGVLKPSNTPILTKTIMDYIFLSGFDGIFDVELIKHNGEYYFIECNFRNGAYGYAYTKYGYNLPDIWITDRKKSELSTEECTVPSVYFMNEFSDIRNIGKSVKFWRWLWDILHCSVCLTYNTKDVHPAWEKCYMQLKKYICRR